MVNATPYPNRSWSSSICKLNWERFKTTTLQTANTWFTRKWVPRLEKEIQILASIIFWFKKKHVFGVGIGLNSDTLDHSSGTCVFQEFTGHFKRCAVKDWGSLLNWHQKHSRWIGCWYNQYITPRNILYIYIDIEKLTNGHGKRTYFLVNTIKRMRWISSQPSCECTEEFNPNTQKFGWYSYRHIKFTTKCLGGGNSNIFLCSSPVGEDEPILTNIFQVGCFNHQPDAHWVPGVWENWWQVPESSKCEARNRRPEMRHARRLVAGKPTKTKGKLENSRAWGISIVGLILKGRSSNWT